MRVLLSLLLLTLGVSSARHRELTDESGILQGLSNYTKLYVTYQNCAWSTYESGCGVNAAGGSYWYMGLTDCYRANVAYSLYGVLKGQADKGCTKASFINSFFTTTGIESFTSYMTNAGVTFTNSETSDCTAQNQNGNNNNQNNAVDYNANNVKVYAGDTSYGIGCAAKSFVLKDYSGAYCDERSVLDVTDKLDTFNTEIDQVQCVAIYDESGTDNSGVLQYSRACDIRLFPDTCPDPYGTLQSSARSSSHSLTAQAHPQREMAKTVFSWFFLGFGIILIIASAWAYYRKQQMREFAKRNSKKKRGIKKGFFSRSASKSQDGGDSNADLKPGFFSRIRSKFSRSGQSV